MKHLMSFLVFISFLGFGASYSQADGLVKLALDYGSGTVKETTPGTSDASGSFLFTGLSGGMVFSGGVYLGAIYEAASSSVTTTTTTKTTATNMGLGLGFVTGNWHFILDYFLTASDKTVDADEDTGTGIGLDIGYGFPIGSSMKFGAELQYRALTFDKYKASPTATEVETDRKTTDMTPRVFLAWKI